jgi:hypothetical protein
MDIKTKSPFCFPMFLSCYVRFIVVAYNFWVLQSKELLLLRSAAQYMGRNEYCNISKPQMRAFEQCSIRIYM